MYRDIKGVMVKFPFVGGTDMTLAGAKTYMAECNIRHLPIIQDDRVVGLITERDLARHENTPDFATVTVGEVIDHPPMVVEETESLTAVLDIMINNKFGSMLIVNDQSSLVGIFTTIDAMLLLKRMLTGGSVPKTRNGNLFQLKDVSGWQG